ncbi:MAG: winged helix-turn-helix domain-containing protein [Chloroflexota bacterium]|nr:winged helix-turn-helix domain-containing protein [Chloroflexota bacterium]
MRLSRRACLRSLHRLGCVYQRPKQRFLEADEEQRAAFVEACAALLAEAQAAGAKIFFVDEAHFRAHGDLHGRWVLKGQRASRLLTISLQILHHRVAETDEGGHAVSRRY